MPRRYVKQVMGEHFRTEEMLWRSSKRAGQEVILTLEAIEKATETINTWKNAQEKFERTIQDKIEIERNRSPVKWALARMGLSSAR